MAGTCHHLGFVCVWTLVPHLPWWLAQGDCGACFALCAQGTGCFVGGAAQWKGRLPLTAILGSSVAWGSPLYMRRG